MFRIHSWHLAGAFASVAMLVGTADAQDQGRLDTNFGDSGWVVTDFGNSDVAAALALQVDGKIVVVGQASGAHLGVARYLPTGDLDASFGEGGIVVTDFGAVVAGRAVAIQGDGRIVVAGQYGLSSRILARYNADGSLDSSFGTGGKLVGGPIDVAAAGVAIQADGKIVTIGGGYISNSWRINRYLPDGTVDTDFGTNGQVVTTSIDFGTPPSGMGIAIQPDGKILGVGVLQTVQFGNRINVGLGLVRYLASGARDPAFGTGGIVATQLGSFADMGHAVAIQRDGRIVVSGSYGGGFGAIRYLSNGALDTSFGSNGIASVSLNQSQFIQSGRPVSLALEDLGTSDQRVILVAGALDNVSDESDFMIVRLLANGSLDTTLPSGGKVRTDFGPNSWANGVALRFDRFYVAGPIGADFGLAKYVNFGQIGLGIIQQYVTSVGCPGETTADNSPGLCGANVSYPAPQLSDPGSYSCSPPSGSFFNVGTTSVGCTAVVGDGSQNQQRLASCSTTVAVADVENPTISCPDVTASTAANSCSATPVIPVLSGDNCAGSTTQLSPPAGTAFGLGTTAYSAMVTDVSGNAASCSAQVTVIDETPPAIQCNTEGVPVRPGVPATFRATATDGCSVASVQVTSYDCWAINSNGKRISRLDDCSVQLSGAEVNVLVPSGVGTFVGWAVRASDGSGNVGAQWCEVQTMNPADSK